MALHGGVSGVSALVYRRAVNPPQLSNYYHRHTTGPGQTLPHTHSRSLTAVLLWRTDLEQQVINTISFHKDDY